MAIITNDYPTHRYEPRRERKRPEWLVLAMLLSLLFWVVLGVMIFG
ncbi:hypothetical protein [Azospirillum sp. SYSU D00513]|nr:hypothetical protein [Azospirillum sp. SYSU D00513]